MPTKTFNDKRIMINSISDKDIRNVKKFLDFINSLVDENAQIRSNKKLSLREEKEWFKKTLKAVKEKKQVFLAAKDEDTIVGTAGISLGAGRQNHVAGLGISIRQGYRGIGLGNYMMEEIIKLAKRQLKPKPKILRLSVLPTNKAAIGLYKKFGFKKVAKIPKQFQYQGKLMHEIVMILEL